MSAATAHAPTAAPKEEFFRYTNMGPVLFGLAIGTGAGLLLAILGGFFFGLEAVPVFVAVRVHVLLHDCHGRDVLDDAPLRRGRRMERRGPASSGDDGNSFTVIWIAFLPIMFWAPRVYKWMKVNPADDPTWRQRARCSIPSCGHVMTVVIFSFFFTTSYTLRWLSTRQDATGDPGYSTKARKVSFAVDPALRHPADGGGHLLGDEHPVPLVLDHVGRVRVRRERVEFDGDADHHHVPAHERGVSEGRRQHGALSTSWASCCSRSRCSGRTSPSTSIFLIWYANIPEETEFFVVRNTESWNTWAIFLEVVCHFFVTFALLCPRAAKTNSKRLAAVAVWVLFLHACDWYFIVNPFLHKRAWHP